jgi:hypothetical protein
MTTPNQPSNNDDVTFGELLSESRKKKPEYDVISETDTFDNYFSKKKNEPPFFEGNDSQIFILQHHNKISPYEVDDVVRGKTTVTQLPMKFLSNSIQAHIFIGIFLFIACAFVGFITYRQAQLTLFSHQVVDGIITNKSTYRCGKNNSSTCYRIDYDYRFRDTPFETYDTVDSNTYHSVGFGDEVDITVSEQHPDISVLGRPTFHIGYWFGVLGLISLPTWWFLSFNMNYHKFRRIQTTGQLIIGQIDNISVSYHKGNMNVSLTYHLKSPVTQEFLKASKTTTRNDLKGYTEKIRIGSPVGVVYANDKEFDIL